MIKEAQTVHFYSKAKAWLCEKGFSEEIDWQNSQNPENITESDFLREAAWVIYCSGFREAVVRRHFNYLSLCFFDWASAERIADNQDLCVASAMHGIGHKRKHTAITEIAKIIKNESFQKFKLDFLENPIGKFERLPFIGKITSTHLAKNLGFNIAKPDRHLVKLTQHLGYDNVDEMCGLISESTGDSVKTVDIVLWRYIERNRIEVFASL